MPRSSSNGTAANAVRESETQAQYAYRQIEEMIVTLSLPPGSRISEKSISAQLGIGRTPVREALQRLAYERTIKVLPRSGAVVSEIDIAEHFKLIEVRRELERILVGRASRLAEPAVCRRFAELSQRFIEAAEAEDESIFLPADAEFNALVAETARNDYAAAAMRPLQAQTRRFWYLYFRQVGDLAHVSRLHAEIAGAIARKDEASGREASDRLVDYVEQYTYRTMRALL
ncbi:MAG: GntR family transcriptional regulator [Zoogloeaceae bacterium]|nr:GntR family transcriptional regulator [Zoogloeaceae bacterium]